MKFLGMAMLALAGLCSAQNPFLGKKFYVNPQFQAELDSSIATATGTVKENLQKMREVGSAYWLDVKSKINGNGTDSAEGILADAATKGELVVFIVYDLPNRDCFAKASNGEICCTYNADRTCNYDAGGDCADGIKEYQTTYIDPLAALLKQWASKVDIVLIIEPDSLPNLATNSDSPHCGNTATTAAYKQGIPYAVNTLAAAAPSIPMYVDAAHGGWLGWDDNMVAFGNIVRSLDITSKIRGFATNVANYQPLGTMCPWQPNSSPTRNDYCLNGANQGAACCQDPCNLESQWNDGNNELNYVQVLSHEFSDFSPQFVIDTGRNGVGDMRSDCANWCNARGAGVGLAPTTNTASPLVDAYFWLKTPGESDGCTETLPDGSKCARFDSMCASADSIGSKSGEPRAPEAGKWFDFQVKGLAQNMVWAEDSKYTAEY